MVQEILTEALSKIRSDKRITDYDEITTKQRIILQVLTILGWNIFSDEVSPEYTLEGNRVDYSLRNQNRNLVFIEVKKPKENLEKHERQLLEYAFKLGVEIAVLTNGITWWFYLPTRTGNWNSRKFFTIDIFEQETHSCSERFLEFLSKDKVLNGEAISSAEKIHKSQVRKKIINETLPESWNRLISEPDSKFVDLIIDSTEKLCGYRPEQKDILDFIKEKQEQILLDTTEDLIVHEKIDLKKSIYKDTINSPSNRKSGLIKVKFNGDIIDVWSIPQLYKKVLEQSVDSGKILQLECPWGLGSKRYFLFKGPNPKHPTGRDFFSPVSYKNFHLEAHVNRKSGIKYLMEFCEEIGYKLEVLES